MPDTGTGTDPTTDRCPDCGHPYDTECLCSCCDSFLIILRAALFVALTDDVARLEMGGQ